MKKVTTFIAKDETEHDSEYKCRRHELKLDLLSLAKKHGFHEWTPDVFINLLENPRARNEMNEIIGIYNKFLIIRGIIDQAEALGW